MRGEQAAPGSARLRGDPARGGAGGLRVVDVAVEQQARYWYPDDGAIVWVAGYSPVDARSGRYLARDAPALAERGLIVTAIAGAARFHDEVLQSGAVAPGAALTLRRQPANEHDLKAIAVLVASGEQLGWAPREVAARVAPLLDAGDRWAAVVLREQRASPRDPRTGLTMLLAPGDTIELREHAGGADARQDEDFDGP